MNDSIYVLSSHYTVLRWLSRDVVVWESPDQIPVESHEGIKKSLKFINAVKVKSFFSSKRGKVLKLGRIPGTKGPTTSRKYSEPTLKIRDIEKQSTITSGERQNT